MTERRKAREIAVQTRYEMAQRGVGFQDPLLANLERRGGGAAVRAYAERLLRTLAEHGDEITSRIAAALSNWSLERVALVDRCILEIGCAEILYFQDVPMRVVINEAVEIAKKFSTDESGAFVNGILDRVARTEATQPRPADGENLEEGS